MEAKVKMKKGSEEGNRNMRSELKINHKEYVRDKKEERDCGEEREEN